MATSKKTMTVSTDNASAEVSAVLNDALPPVPCPGPGGYVYTGMRYVPVFADPIEWSSANTYEPLEIVTHEGNSYTSKTFVPSGIDISNSTYWVLTSNFNAQVEQYRKEVAAISDIINTKMPKRYNTVDDMKGDTGIKAGDYIVTKGYYSIGDGGAAEYYVDSIDSSNVSCVAVSNSLFAHTLIEREMAPEQFGATLTNVVDQLKFMFLNGITVLLKYNATYTCGDIDLGNQLRSINIVGNKATLKNFTFRQGLNADFTWTYPFTVAYVYAKDVSFTNENASSTRSVFEGACFTALDHVSFNNVNGILTIPYNAYLDEVNMRYINVTTSGGFAQTRDLITVFNNTGGYVNGAYKGDNWLFEHVHYANGNSGAFYFLTVGNNYNVNFSSCMNLYVNIPTTDCNVVFHNCHFEKSKVIITNGAPVLFTECYINSYSTISDVTTTRFDSCFFGYNNNTSTATNGTALKCAKWAINNQLVNCKVTGLTRCYLTQHLTPRTNASFTGSWPTSLFVAVESGGTSEHLQVGTYTYTCYPSLSPTIISAPSSSSPTANVTAASQIVAMQIGTAFQEMYCHIYKTQPDGKIFKIVIPPKLVSFYDLGASVSGIENWEQVDSLPSVTPANYLCGGGNTVLYKTDKPVPELEDYYYIQKV